MAKQFLADGVSGKMRSLPLDPQCYAKHSEIILRRAEDLKLRMYADASYGGEGGRPGVLTTLGRQAVGWYSRQQEVDSLSISEVEYIADCEGTKDAAWAQQFLVELGITTIPSLRIEPDLQLRLAESTQRAYPPAELIRQAEDQSDPKEEQSCRHPHQAPTDECSEWIESVMDEYLRASLN